MAVIYGYARCSTDESRQDIDRQRRELHKMGITDEHIYWEYESGSSKGRPEFTKILNILQPGDTLAATEVSRLTRSTSQLCEVMQLAQDRHICLQIGTIKIDCREKDMDPMTKGMLMIWGVFSEMERDMISQRVKSGMANAKAKGKHVGRPRTTEATIPAIFMKHLPAYRRGDLTKTEFARVCGLSRMSIYKYLAILDGEKERQPDF